MSAEEFVEWFLKDCEEEDLIRLDIPYIPEIEIPDMPELTPEKAMDYLGKAFDKAGELSDVLKKASEIGASAKDVYDLLKKVEDGGATAEDFYDWFTSQDFEMPDLSNPDWNLGDLDIPGLDLPELNVPEIPTTGEELGDIVTGLLKDHFGEKETQEVATWARRALVEEKMSWSQVYGVLQKIAETGNIELPDLDLDGVDLPEVPAEVEEFVTFVDDALENGVKEVAKEEIYSWISENYDFMTREDIEAAIREYVGGQIPTLPEVPAEVVEAVNSVKDIVNVVEGITGQIPTEEIFNWIKENAGNGFELDVNKEDIVDWAMSGADSMIKAELANVLLDYIKGDLAELPNVPGMFEDYVNGKVDEINGVKNEVASDLAELKEILSSVDAGTKSELSAWIGENVKFYTPSEILTFVKGYVNNDLAQLPVFDQETIDAFEAVKEFLALCDGETTYEEVIGWLKDNKEYYTVEEMVATVKDYIDGKLSVLPTVPTDYVSFIDMVNGLFAKLDGDVNVDDLMSWAKDNFRYYSVQEIYMTIKNYVDGKLTVLPTVPSDYVEVIGIVNDLLAKMDGSLEAKDVLAWVKDNFDYYTKAEILDYVTDYINNNIVDLPTLTTQAKEIIDAVQAQLEKDGIVITRDDVINWVKENVEYYTFEEITTMVEDYINGKLSVLPEVPAELVEVIEIANELFATLDGDVEMEDVLGWIKNNFEYYTKEEIVTTVKDYINGKLTVLPTIPSELVEAIETVNELLAKMDGSVHTEDVIDWVKNNFKYYTVEEIEAVVDAFLNSEIDGLPTVPTEYVDVMDAVQKLMEILDQRITTDLIDAKISAWVEQCVGYGQMKAEEVYAAVKAYLSGKIDELPLVKDAVVDYLNGKIDEIHVMEEATLEALKALKAELKDASAEVHAEVIDWLKENINRADIEELVDTAKDYVNGLINTLPEFDMPEIDIPDLDVPGIDLPELSFPDFELPEWAPTSTKELVDMVQAVLANHGIDVYKSTVQWALANLDDMSWSDMKEVIQYVAKNTDRPDVDLGNIDMVAALRGLVGTTGEIATVMNRASELGMSLTEVVDLAVDQVIDEGMNRHNFVTWFVNEYPTMDEPVLL